MTQNMRFLACIVLSAAAACAERSEPVTSPAVPDGVLSDVTASGAFNPFYGAQADVAVSTNAYASEVESAIDAWNAAWAPSDNTPTLSMSGGLPLTVTFTGSGPYACGVSGGGSVEITLGDADTLSVLCGGGRFEPVSDMVYLLIHEIGHALGYRHFDAWDATHDCVMDVPPIGTPLNRSICVHEQQMAFWKYGERDSVDLDHPMITGLSLDPLALDPGDTIWVQPEYVQSDGGSGTVAPVLPPNWSIDDSTTVARILQVDGDRVQIEAIAGGTTTLRAELEPDPHVVWPGPSAQASISVSGPPLSSGPAACFTAEGTNTWRLTDQYLNADCSAEGANIRYLWQFEENGPWTDTLTTTLFDFEGHGTSGTKTVSLKVVDLSTGRDSVTTQTFDVSNDQMLVSGPTGIAVKQKYSYYSSDPALWWERYSPSLTWEESVDWYTDSIGRIWPAGEYEVDLRAADDRSGRLRRGRLSIVVCTSTQTCESGPGSFAAGGPAGASTAAFGGGAGRAIFGAGPVITWTDGGTPRALHFYHLMGNHDVRSVFASPAWLTQDGGEVSNADYPGGLAWTREPITGGAVYHFTVRPPTQGEYTFGFSLDPDLGTSAADDRSGFDPASGMVYARDGTRAVGFLLRRASGEDASASVTQFGTGRFAPDVPARVAEAQRRGGVNLVAGASDVQFLIAAAPARGVQQYRLVILEADRVSDLLALARQVR